MSLPQWAFSWCTQGPIDYSEPMSCRSRYSTRAPAQNAASNAGPGPATKRRQVQRLERLRVRARTAERAAFKSWRM